MLPNLVGKNRDRGPRFGSVPSPGASRARKVELRGVLEAGEEPGAAFHAALAFVETVRGRSLQLRAWEYEPYPKSVHRSAFHPQFDCANSKMFSLVGTPLKIESAGRLRQVPSNQIVIANIGADEVEG